MIHLPRAALEARALERPPGYFDEVSAVGNWVRDGEIELLELSEEKWQELALKFGSISPSRPLAISEWRGAGDMVEFLARKLGLAALTKWLEKATGKTCGCERRRAWLNQRFPFAPSSRFLRRLARVLRIFCK